MFRAGEIDAEFARVAQYQELSPNAMRVSEPVGGFPVYVYSMGKTFDIDGWDSLLPYKILTLSGWLYTLDKLKQYSTLEVESPQQAFKLLKVGRAELFATGLFQRPVFFNHRNSSAALLFD